MHLPVERDVDPGSVQPVNERRRGFLAFSKLFAGCIAKRLNAIGIRFCCCAVERGDAHKVVVDLNLVSTQSRLGGREW